MQQNTRQVFVGFAFFCAVFFVPLAIISCSHDPLEEKKVPESHELRTVMHDGHMWVIYHGYNSGGLSHHPGCDCLDSSEGFSEINR